MKIEKSHSIEIQELKAIEALEMVKRRGRN